MSELDPLEMGDDILEEPDKRYGILYVGIGIAMAAGAASYALALIKTRNPN